MKILSAAFFICVLVGVACARDEINLLDSSHLWGSPASKTKIKFTASQLFIVADSSAPGIYNRVALGISTADYDLLMIKMKTSAGGIGEVSWTAKESRFSPFKNYPFYLRPPGRYYTYYLNLAGYNLKRQKIDHLLFFPMPGPGTAEIKEFKLIRGTPWEKALAGWQEFFGPRGREPDGFNFLVIRSPRLFGKPFLLYINLALFSFLLIVFLLQSKLNLRLPFIAALFACWLLLEASTLLNQGIALQRDRRFLGKTLEEKRALINTKDFYPFLKFADRELSAGAGYSIKVSGFENDKRTAYYLHPRAYSSAYLLIFDAKIDKVLLKRYSVWKKFREGAYILKHVTLP